MSSLREMQNSAMAALAKAQLGSGDPPPTMPERGVERNESGPQGSRIMVSRKPPGRSKSHKIGRPAFSKELPPEPQRGVNRNKSGRLRFAPNRTRSFGRTVPDRSGSTGSLKAYRKQQQLGGTPSEGGDDVSVSDSVFTSASNQTLDSIMLRKKQFGPGDVKPGGMRMPSRSSDISTASFEFDDSLHTVDSINVHHRHVDNGRNDEPGDLSVFSESFASTDTYALSDYDEDEEGADVQEVEFEEDFEGDFEGDDEEENEVEYLKEPEEPQEPMKE